MPEFSNTDLQRAHRWGWPSLTAVVFSGAPLLALAGFWVGAYIVPAVLTGERLAPPHDGMQSVIRETPAVEVMTPFEEKKSIQLLAAKAKLTAMVEASSPAPAAISSPAPAAISNISTNGAAHPGEVAALDRHEPTEDPVASPTASGVPLPPARPHLSAAMVSRAVPLPPHRPVESAPPPDVTLPDRHAVQ